METTDSSIKRSFPNEANESSFKKPRLTQQERAKLVVQESEVGITQYINEVNKTGGFYGAIKTLYTDFIVNEIDTNNNVVHLTDEGVAVGKSRKEKKLEKRQQTRAEFQGKSAQEIEELKEARRIEGEAKPKYELSDEHREQLLTHLSTEELKQIEELFTTGSKVETSTTFPEKQARGTLHKLLREAFQSKLDTTTSNENKFVIVLAKNSNNNRNQNQNRQESINHVDENGVVNYGLGTAKEYLHFTVYKENRDTMEISGLITKFLRIPTKNIGFAGTKDRRGVTCQRFSIYHGKVARITGLNKGLKNAVLGGFSYEDQPLGLGDLNGNEFIITIRDVKPIVKGDNVENDITKSFESLKNKGFINYYGMQRFGTFSVSTHILGIHLLKGEWKAAAQLVLAEQEIVAEESIEARRIWAETGDAFAALKKMPRRFTAETCILNVLKEETNNNGYSAHSYFKGIISIPRNLRLMYVHAYQSYVWNLVVSKRFELFGLEVQVGDLVYHDQAEEKTKVEQEIKDDEEDEFDEDVAAKPNFVRARPLTKEDVESGNFTIFDVVLPTPGFDIIYPANEELKQVYVDTMAKDGLDPDNMTRKVRDFSLSGSYRKIMGRANNLVYNVVNYKEDTTPLVRTDLEILRIKKEAAEKGEPIPEVSRVIDDNGPDADKKAVILSMQLGTSSYATMALREFMKADSSKIENP